MRRATSARPPANRERQGIVDGAARATRFAGREPPRHYLNRAPAPRAFVFQLTPQLSEATVRNCPRQMPVFHHARHVQIFNDNGALGFREPVRKVVKGVRADVGDARMKASNAGFVLLEVAALAQRTLCLLCRFDFAAQGPLQPLQLFEISGQRFRVLELASVATGRQRLDAKIYTDNGARLARLRLGNVRFHLHRNEPPARLFADSGRIELRAFGGCYWNVATLFQANPTDFREIDARLFDLVSLVETHRADALLAALEPGKALFPFLAPFATAKEILKRGVAVRQNRINAVARMLGQPRRYLCTDCTQFFGERHRRRHLDVFILTMRFERLDFARQSPVVDEPRRAAVTHKRRVLLVVRLQLGFKSTQDFHKDTSWKPSGLSWVSSFGRRVATIRIGATLRRRRADALFQWSFNETDAPEWLR